MRYSIIIYILGRYAPLNESVHFVLENPSKSLKYSIFSDQYVWLTSLDIFHKWDFSHMCGKQRSIYPPVFYSPRSYTINVLKINCGLLPTVILFRNSVLVKYRQQADTSMQRERAVPK